MQKKKEDEERQQQQQQQAKIEMQHRHMKQLQQQQQQHLQQQQQQQIMQQQQQQQVKQYQMFLQQKQRHEQTLMQQQDQRRQNVCFLPSYLDNLHVSSLKPVRWNRLTLRKHMNGREFYWKRFWDKISERYARCGRRLLVAYWERMKLYESASINNMKVLLPFFASSLPVLCPFSVRCYFIPFFDFRSFFVSIRVHLLPQEKMIQYSVHLRSRAVCKKWCIVKTFQYSYCCGGSPFLLLLWLSQVANLSDALLLARK